MRLDVLAMRQSQSEIGTRIRLPDFRKFQEGRVSIIHRATLEKL